jgi:CRP-like cAMP-binding protein
MPPHVRLQTESLPHRPQSGGSSAAVFAAQTKVAVNSTTPPVSTRPHKGDARLPAQNRLIAALPAARRASLLALCEPVDLKLSERLFEAGEATRYVYFPVDAFISLLAQIDEHPSLEMGMVGREGMLGLQLSLGVSRAPLGALVQGEGRAWRLGAAAFRAELSRSLPLRLLLQRYLYVRLAQLASAAGCLRFHQIGPRLARWLLMSQDRAGHAQLAVTQEFLAFMLGVRRVGVTQAAGAMQRSGLIRYHRGLLTVLDRAGLEAAACSCYACDQGHYAAQFPALSVRRRTDSSGAGA